MKRALRIFSVAAAVMAVVCVTPLRGVGSGQTPQEKYIEKWATTAVREMYRSGVPASITLSQGLLESRYGLSSLALEGNNHFGIKCHNNWTGGRMYYDDDAKGECFRKYVSADESFSDHSDFLRYRDRYKFLFEYETTDYKSWAYGLKKAGYATDPSYATKLIKYIEDYKLYVYDTMTVGDVDSESEWNDLQDGDSLRQGGKLTRKQKKVLKKAQKAAAKGKNSGSGNAAGGSDTSPGNDATRDVIPKSPLKLEEPTKVDKSQYEEFHFSLSRQMYERNGVPYVLSVEGET